MPRSPLPARETAICRRLRVWREQHAISRKDFADKLGLRPDSYSAYEYARAPVRYDLAFNIIATFGINAQWLATGEGPDSVSIKIPPPTRIGVSPRELFSTVFDSQLAQEIAKKTTAIVNQHSPVLNVNLSVSIPGIVERTTIREMLVQQVAEWLVKVPDASFMESARNIFALTSDQFNGIPRDVPAIVEQRRLAIEAHELIAEKARKALGIFPK